MTDWISRLEQAKRLLDAGALTPEEFEAEKLRLLPRAASEQTDPETTSARRTARRRNTPSPMIVALGVVSLALVGGAVLLHHPENAESIAGSGGLAAPAAPIGVSTPSGSIAPATENGSAKAALGAEVDAIAARARAATAPSAPTLSSKPLGDITAAWLAGWWSVDGFCEGDAGETFEVGGGWGEWGVDGVWSLQGRQLTITRRTTTLDTASGKPEQISPPLTTTGTIRNPSADSFDLDVSGGVRHMVRCEE